MIITQPHSPLQSQTRRATVQSHPKGLWNGWEASAGVYLRIGGRRALLRNEYPAAENRILRDQIKGRVQLSDTEGWTLAVIGKKLSQQALEEVASIVKPDTILAWHRKLVTQKYEESKKRKYGRPRVDPELEALVVRLARENRPWGCDRFQGA